MSATQLDVTGNVPGTFAYAPAADTVLGAGDNQMLLVTITPSDTIDCTTATATATINIPEATPTIGWPSRRASSLAPH